MRANSIAAFTAGALGGLIAATVYKRNQRPRRPPRSGPQVVVLGAGFAGMAAASRIVRLAGHRARVTLVDKHNYHLFTPMLYQVAACAVVPYDVAIPVRPFISSRGIQFRQAAITDIDFSQRQVVTDTGSIAYDYLVIALGSTTNFFGNRAAEEHAIAMKSLEDGVLIRNRVIDMLETASRESDPDKRRKLLTFVVIGGGATGVEMAGALATFLRYIVPKDYPTIGANDCRIVLLEGAPKLLGHMSNELAEIALRELRAMGVEVWLDAMADEVTPDQITTQDGRSLQRGLVVWATGVRAPDVIGALDVNHGRGGSITVNEFLQVPPHGNVFAAGDNAGVTHKGRPVPLLAASAVQEGNAVGSNIARLIQGRPLRPFHYVDLGNVISLGHGSGVAEIGGKVFAGFTAWLIWRVVHLVRLTSVRNKLATALDWSTGWFYEVDTARLEDGERGKPAA